ncbi:MAG: hypothetical protein ABMA13_19405 [Chthoniobacteraceae bacterium]
MTEGVSHDEHQHIAAGMLWGRDGLLPYRDFPLFHTPYLTFVYGWLFRLTDYPLLAARLFSAGCATAMVALIGAVAFRAFRDRGTKVAWRVAMAVTGLCVVSSLFTGTTGRAWNQEPSTLLAVGAFVLLGHGLDSARRGWLLASGALLGLAIGMRITYAPLIAPLGLATLLGAQAWGVRLRAAMTFSAGLLAALAGVFVLYAKAPEAFIFGNFEFAQASIDYRMATGEPRTMTLGKKIRFLWKEIVRGDAGFMLATLLPVLTTLWLAWKKRVTVPAPLRRFALALPFVLWGSMAPSPVFDQYFYPLVPFLALAGIYSLAALPVGSRAWLWNWRAGLAGLVLAVGSAVRTETFDGLDHLFQPHKWATFEAHREGIALREHLPSGRVLTLAPLLPLEAGLRIDPAFAPGPFAWRVADYIDPAKARRLGIVTPATLAEHLAAVPPDGVLTGAEETGEAALVDYARARGFIAHPLEEEQRIWAPPR